MMRTRITVGAFILVLLGILFWLDRDRGGYFVCLVAVVVTALALYELFMIARSAGLQPFTATGIAFGTVLLPYYMWSDVLWQPLRLQAFVAFIMAPLLALVLATMARASTRPEGLEPQFKNIAVTVFGVLYIALPMAFLVRTRLLTDDGWGLVLLVIAVTKASDVGAYFAGTTLGRHKLAPRVSPNKTVEGAIGGLVASSLTALAFAHLLQVQILLLLGPIATLSFGIAVGVASQAGDLTESLIKRSANVKDSGNFLPAFGGVLDLIDSFLVAAPVAYFLLSIFARATGRLGAT